MKLIFTIILITMSFTSYEQTYTNGTKFKVTKLVYTDLDDNVKESF